MSEAKPFLSDIYCGPHNEYVEEHRGNELHGRILYDGIEVATLCYCEDYRWAHLYAAAPELLEACYEAIAALGGHDIALKASARLGVPAEVNQPAQTTIDKLADAIAKATGNS